MQRELDTMREELERASQLAGLGTLLACIAHEFNNILTPVRGYASAALRRPDQAELTQKALRHAESGAGRAAMIARSILELAADPRYAADPEGDGTSDPVEVFRSVVSLVGLEDPNNEISVTIDAEPGLIAGVAPTVLHQMLLNLMMNAVRAMGGEGRLLFRAARSTCNTLRIELTDTGCGIAPERLQLVMEAFVTDAPEQHRRGTGLGLALCQRLCERVGGTLSLASELGVGTTCTLTLPAIKNHS